MDGNNVNGTLLKGYRGATKPRREISMLDGNQAWDDARDASLELTKHSPPLDGELREDYVCRLMKHIPPTTRYTYQGAQWYWTSFEETIREEWRAMSANPRPHSCESRIEAEMKSRIEALRHVAECQYLDDEASENVVRDYEEGILSVDVHKVHRICMSYGGPEDYWDVTTDNDGDITSINYIFQDVGDSATRSLKGDDLKIAKRVLAPYTWH